MEKQWYVFYTKSRQEKKVRDLLLKNGYDVFLPLQKVVRQWSDRKKKVEVPLFSSYIFVNDAAHRIPSILQVPGIAWSIKHNGKPAFLRDDEHELIQKFLATGIMIETSAAVADELKKGDKAQVIGGALQGMVGVLTGDSNNPNFNVVLESIDQVIRLKIPVNLLKKM